MTQSQIDHSESRVTGESMREIRHRGFSIAEPVDVDFDPEPCQLRPQIVDWDQLDAQRPSLFP
jgi:hypothetical protein